MPCRCNTVEGPALAAPSTSPRRRPRLVTSLLPCALPIATLALLPKCPACFAAYVLLFTGIGLSLSAASALRLTFIVLSLPPIAYFLFRAARQLVSSRVGSPRAEPALLPPRR